MLDRGSPDRPSAAPHCFADVERLLFVEAQHLDDKTWEAWANLYQDDANYWAPSWLDEYELVNDSDTQVSYIYHTSRAQLRERIGRI